jgi:DNA-binding NtrC family response regulator
MSGKGSILVVDDEASQRDILRAILTAEGYTVTTAPAAPEAVALAAERHFDLVLTDLRMPGPDGLTLVGRLTREEPPTLVILMTAYGSLDSAEQAVKRGAFDYLTKPLERDELLLTAGRAMERIRLTQENRLLRHQLEERFRIEGLVGSHFRMQEVFDRIQKIAGSASTVLIQGESGTGKELVARSIHRHSPRRDRPFVGLSCAAIPETLVESELFGHEKGAFTGAVARKIGLFEMADKSTIFLDEIGELNVGMQAKVLRAIQEREVRRVGGREDVKVDVRIITATNKDLEAEVKAGRFREDLYYRINVVRLTLPPVRERSTDVPQLVHYFMEKAARAGAVGAKGITTDATRVLMHYSWPGNVRQLEAVIERAALLCEGREIDTHDLPFEVRFAGLPAQSPAPPGGTAGAAGATFALPDAGIDLEAVERDLIRQAMEKSGWVIAKAAKLLGLSYRTLQYRLEKFQLRRDKDSASEAPGGAGA